MVAGLGAELLSLMPIDATVLEACWYTKYQEADPSLMLELASARQERKETLSVSDFTFLKEVMANHAGSRPISDVGHRVVMQQLEQDSFDLVIKQLQYDLQALRIARQKRSSWESAVYHQKLQYRVDAFEHAVKASTAFFKNNVKVECASTSEDLLTGFHKFMNEALAKLKMPPESAVQDLIYASFCKWQWVAICDFGS